MGYPWRTGDALLANDLNAAFAALGGTGFLPLTGGTLIGALTLWADPSTPLQAATKNYVDVGFVPNGGGTMTGYLTLSGDPASGLHAATKHYVDGLYAVGLPPGGPFLPLAGGTVTGATTLASGAGNGFLFTGAATNPTLAVSGSGTNGAMVLRSQGSGSLNLGSATGGNILLLQSAVSSTDTLTLLQPSVVGNPFTLGSTQGGGININVPATFTRTWTYAGTQAALANQPMTWNQTISGTSANTSSFFLNNMVFNYNNFTTGYSPYGLTIRGLVNAGSIVRTNVPLSVTANQGGAPGVVAAWAPSASYTTLGGLAYNVGNLYMVTVGGTSASSGGPTGTGTAIVDGTVTWRWVDIRANSCYQVAFGPSATTNYNAGGSAGAPIGSNFGMVVGAILQSNSTFYNQNVGMEIDQGVGASSSTVRNAALQVVNTGPNQGSFQDWGISISGPGGKFRNPLIFQSATDPLGYAIQFMDQNTGGVQTMAGGIDMQMVVPTGVGPAGGGFFARWANGMIDASGNITASYGAVRPTANGLQIDARRLQCTTIASIVSGGTGWNTGNNAKGTDGSIISVTASGGVVTAASLVIAGWADAAPANPVTFAPIGGNAALVTATGTATVPTSFTANVTYAASATPGITVGASTDRLGFFGTTPAVKATFSGAKGGNTALASVIAALVAYGIATDTTTA